LNTRAGVHHHVDLFVVELQSGDGGRVGDHRLRDVLVLFGHRVENSGKNGGGHAEPRETFHKAAAINEVGSHGSGELYRELKI
jgi:hypothetical protein